VRQVGIIHPQALIVPRRRHAHAAGAGRGVLRDDDCDLLLDPIAGRPSRSSAAIAASTGRYGIVDVSRTKRTCIAPW
jgi:hypothetical protein